MKRVASPEDLAANPVERYWASAVQLVWCHSPTLCGCLHWGHPQVRDAQELTRALELSRHPDLAPGFDVYMDSRGLERLEWPPVETLFAYVRQRLAEWGTRIRRQAVVVPEGPIGALLAGLVPLVGMTYPLRFFSDREPAMAFLGRPDLIDALDEAERLAHELRGIVPVVHRLRTWLEGSLVGATVEDAARALGVAPRTLQRELQAAGTRFTSEVHEARVRVASAMLVNTDEKIESIARVVGYTSASQLSAIFRRIVGETPAAFRARARGVT